MHEIVIKETEGVYVEFIDLLTTHTPFYHVDRIAKYDVLIYVISGYIYVTEEEMNYEIGPGQMHPSIWQKTDCCRYLLDFCSFLPRGN